MQALRGLGVEVRSRGMGSATFGTRCASTVAPGRVWRSGQPSCVAAAASHRPVGQAASRQPHHTGRRRGAAPVPGCTSTPSFEPRGSVVPSAGGAAPGASDKPLEYAPEFVRRRLLVFISIVVGYSSYYLTRNSLTYTAPVMVADPSLGMDITMVGAMTSVFPIAYGMSKFVSGVLGAKISPTYLLAGGLMCTALINIAFGFGTSLAWFCFFWALNGTLQGVGGPCCARILTTWFAGSERGTYWGMWNIAHNLGGFAAPLVAGGFAKAMGWQWGMWAPGCIGLAVGIFVLLACKDKPEDIGYPPVEPVQDKPKKQDDKKADSPGIWDSLLNNVLKNPFIWGMALTYFFIYVVRQGVTSWFVFYLLKEKGVEDAAQAAVRVSGLELGGLMGSLIAGKASDWLISRSGGKGGNVGQRVKVVMAYTVGIAASLLAFQAIPGTLPWLQWFNVFMIGFFIYGPQMLIGLCGAEMVGPQTVGASEGFLGWVAYLGAANAGIPLSIIVKQFGWDAYFGTLIVACGLAVLLLSPMTRLRSFVQREAVKAKRAE
uniref:Major facilitator superfamily (MFS) profile domain-containing protein n=1 Tax=Chlamydomonas euryale TaxID=1486919 RepID=A0A7R9V7P4_9CHLO|mmetsp:Transcript_24022/g.71266  ORF Transcript_24022/g.71266 Transcript_24022/m.71266 type:complete len:545 (+) Transcript_24022:288-1922(+)